MKKILNKSTWKKQKERNAQEAEIWTQELSIMRKFTSTDVRIQLNSNNFKIFKLYIICNHATTLLILVK